MKHFKATVTGTYPDPADPSKKKKAFEAQLYLQYPYGFSRMDVSKTCILDRDGNDKSTITISRQWAESKGLLIDNDCKLEFHIVRNEDGTMYPFINFMDKEGTGCLHPCGPEKTLLTYVKAKVASEYPFDVTFAREKEEKCTCGTVVGSQAAHKAVKRVLV